MERWFFSFVTAIFLSLLWPELPAIHLLPIFLILSSLVLRLPKGKWISGCLLGTTWIASVGHWQLHWQPPSEYFQQPVQIKGKVVSLVHQQDALRFNLRVEQVGQRNYWLKPLYRLSLHEYAGTLRQGDMASFEARLKPIHGLANEGGFHYQQWLFSQGIVATGYISQVLEVEPAKIPELRQWLSERFYQLELKQARWIAALSFGDRSQFTPSDWQLVQRTGIAHLVAISGLHLSIVASFSYLLFANAFVSLSAFMPRALGAINQLSPNKFGLLAAVLVTLVYVIVAGASIPTLRAWIMLLIASLLICLNINWPLRKFLLICLFFFLLLFPLSIFSLSFWLSFAAILSVWFVLWRWPSKAPSYSVKAFLLIAFRTQLLIGLLLMPLVAWQFSLISWASPVVNLIAVPLVTFVILPLCLFGVICLFVSMPLSQWVFDWADSLITHSLAGLSWLNEHAISAIELSSMPLAVWVCLMLAVILWTLPQLPISRWWSCLFLLPLVSYQVTPNSASWRLDVLDVGQGLAIVISKNRRAMVYDVGAYYPSGFNMADAALLPFLQNKGVTQLDYVFISHGDNDHIGSLPMLLAKMPVNKLLTYDSGCDQSLYMHWQGLEIKGLWPQIRRSKQRSGNDTSCVLLISDGQHRVLLPGDIGRGIEIELLQRYTNSLEVDVLIAPHHGSNTSSSGSFVAATSPKHVVFSQGFMNRWGFPKAAVIERYQRNSQAQLYNTANSGQVSFRFSTDEKIQVKEFRRHIFPYWYAN